MALRDKTNEEITRLLDEYCIKHGPVVESTRRLYEKRLEKAMGISSAQPDYYYREEEDWDDEDDDETAYIPYRTMVTREGYASLVRQRGGADLNGDRESAEDTEPEMQIRTRTAGGRAARPKTWLRKCVGFLLWVIRLMIVSLVTAIAIYYIYYLLMIKNN